MGSIDGEPIVMRAGGRFDCNPDCLTAIVAAVSKTLRVYNSACDRKFTTSRTESGPHRTMPMVVRNAPSTECLKKAFVCITLQGFNTVIEALTQGVPQIAIPVPKKRSARRRCQNRKKGRQKTSLDGLDGRICRPLLDEVFKQPIYRD